MSSPPPPRDWLELGVIVRAHGVKGELRFVPFDPELALPELPLEVRVTSKRGAERLMTLCAVRTTHQALLIRLEGVDERNGADELKGARVFVPPSAIPPPAEGEAFVFELEGALAVDPAGQPLGTVTAVLAGAGQDLLQIDTPRGERLVPLVPEIVLRIEREARRVVIAVPEGLWDD